MAAQPAPPLPIALSPVQVAFLVSLVSGPRPTAECQDAMTVGSLMRLNLVAWDETQRSVVKHRHGTSTFSLTPAAERFLTERDARNRVG